MLHCTSLYPFPAKVKRQKHHQIDLDVPEYYANGHSDNNKTLKTRDLLLLARALKKDDGNKNPSSVYDMPVCTCSGMSHHPPRLRVSIRETLNSSGVRTRTRCCNRHLEPSQSVKPSIFALDEGFLARPHGGSATTSLLVNKHICDRAGGGGCSITVAQIRLSKTCELRYSNTDIPDPTQGNPQPSTKCRSMLDFANTDFCCRPHCLESYR